MKVFKEYRVFERDFEAFKAINKDLFANHRAEITIPSTNNFNDCIINFEDNDSVMTISYIDGVISISGDYGYMMFDRSYENKHITDYTTIDSISSVLVNYVANDNNYFKFSSEAFEKDWNNWKALLIEEGYPIEEVESFKKPCSESEISIVDFFNNFHEIDDLFEYGCYSFGMRMTSHTLTKWYGFQQAVNSAFLGGN